MNKHEMTIEGGRKGSKKRKAAKTTKKRSGASQKIAKWKRQASQVLAGVGFITVVGAIVYLIVGG